MSLKSALQADLAAKGMNLGDLAGLLDITQQSVSKWIAKDEIPRDRIDEVLAVVGSDSRTAAFIVEQVAARIGGIAGSAAGMLSVIGGKGVPERSRDLPTPGDEDEDTRPSPLAPLYQQILTGKLPKPAPVVLPVPTTPRFSMRQPSNMPAAEMESPRARVMRWAKDLDPSYAANVLRAIEVHGTLRRLDYLSDKLALVVRPPPTVDPGMLIQSAVPLMLAHATSPPTLQCKLVLLPRTELGLDDRADQPPRSREVWKRRLDIVRLDLQLLGVTLVELSHVTEVARLIHETELGIYSNPPFSYEEEDENDF